MIVVIILVVVVVVVCGASVKKKDLIRNTKQNKQNATNKAQANNAMKELKCANSKPTVFLVK